MRHLFTALLVASAIVGPAAAQDKSWVGKTIILKKSGVKIGQSDAKGNQVFVATLTMTDYRVLGEQDGWIKVKDGRANEGWFDKVDAVVLEDAVAFFTDRIRQNPNSSDAYNRRAIAHQLQGKLDEAIDDFGQSLRLNPSAVIHCNRGNAWRVKKEYDKAIADYDDSLRIDPKHFFGYLNRGIAWSSKKEYDKAIADFGEAVRLDPKYVLTYFSRGNAWAAKKEYEKAIADYNEAIRLDPKHVGAYNRRAWIQATCFDARFRDGKKAIETAKKGLELAPKDADLMDTLAAAYAEIGDFAEAVRMEERAIAITNNAGYRSRLELYKKMQPFRLK